MFSISLSDIFEGKFWEVILNDHPLLKEFVNAYPSDTLNMLSNYGINFWIDLILGVEPIS